MKTMYKLLLVFACIVLLTLCACGEQSSQEPASPINGESGQMITADDESKTEELTALFEEGVSRIYCLSINEPILILEDVFGDVFAPFGLGYIHDVVFVSLLSVRCVPFRLPQHVRRASHCMKKPDRLR